MTHPKALNNRISLIALLGLFFFGAASIVQAQPTDRPYEITTTTGMIADIVRAVAGDHAKVHNIIGEGIDPHLYRPTRSDLMRLQSADVIFYNGLMLEGRMGDVLSRLGRTKPVFAVTELLAKDYLIPDEEDDEMQFDPHVWMDVQGWMHAVDAVADSLATYDPKHAQTYHANASAYREQLKALDNYTRKAIASIPEENRVLVTAHDAFGYFGRAYGLKVIGIQGISTESEAGVREINELVQFMVDHRLNAIFVETSVADKNIRAIIEGARSRGHEIVIGGELFSDAMGQAGTYEGTYIGMIDHNATTITRALGGDVPDRGMKGKLAP